jgi:NADPH:quinone reductase-like Zn-dependent oxidoreductase
VKAVRLHQFGGPEVLRLEDVPDPAPMTGDVLLRVRACGLNHLDVDCRAGVSRLPLVLPHTLGREIAGEVVALGPGVDSVRVGDRVLAHIAPACGRCGACLAGRDNLCQTPNLPGIHRPGGYAELAVVSAWGIEAIPPQLSFQEAAAVPIAFGTAWHMLITRGRLRAGETVLIQAAGSTIGSAAIQVARLAGARVLTTAGSDAKLSKAKALGAHEAINYREEDLVAAVRKHADGRGVDLVFEHIGGEVFTQSLACLVPGGRMAVCGAHAGEVVPLDIIEFFRREIDLLGSFRATSTELRQVFSLVVEGRLRPVIHAAFPLAEAAEAHRVMERREHFGKLLLVP